MNSVLKHALSNFLSAWEPKGFGAILRPRLYLREKGKLSTLFVGKYKTCVDPRPGDSPWSDSLNSSQVSAWVGTGVLTSVMRQAKEKRKSLYTIDDKVIEVYTDLRGHIVPSYLSAAGFQRESGSKLLMRYTSLLYKETLKRKFDDFPNGDANYSCHYLELDLDRKPGDRLAIVSAPWVDQP